MQNELPRQLDRLFSRGEDMAAGCTEHEVAIGLMQNKATNINADLLAARTAQNAFQTARAGKLSAVDAQSVADANATAFIVKARDVLKTHLGNSWSQVWSEAGFVSGSLAVPASLAGRIALLMSLNAYFAAHPAHQANDLSVTAAAALNQHGLLSDARAAANAGRADVGTKRSARDTAAQTLRKRMRGLITELTQLLPGEDARWNAFGLNRPDAVGIPEVPEGLLVVGGGAGHLLATWEGAPLADRYRVFKKVVGVDNEFVFAATVTDTESNLNTFTPGQVVRVRVTAVNDAGESLPGDSVEQSVP